MYTKVQPARDTKRKELPAPCAVFGVTYIYYSTILAAANTGAHEKKIYLELISVGCCNAVVGAAGSNGVGGGVGGGEHSGVAIAGDAAC